MIFLRWRKSRPPPTARRRPDDETPLAPRRAIRYRGLSLNAWTKRRLNHSALFPLLLFSPHSRPLFLLVLVFSSLCFSFFSLSVLLFQLLSPDIIMVIY